MIRHKIYQPVRPIPLGFLPLSQRIAYALFWVAWGALLGAGIGHGVGEESGLLLGSLVGGIAFGVIHWAWVGRPGR